jgi:hypothetical protein
MIRYFVLLFNMVGVLIFRTFFVDDVTVKQNVPAKANPGDEFTVEVTINKGSMGGFAQLKCELPEGLTATQGEVSGSEFKFSGQIVRFTWTSLPGDATLKVSYKVKVAPGTNGVKSITGKFSYVLNNVKNSVELNASEITIGTPVVDNVDNTVTTSPTTTTTPPDNTTTTSNNNNTSTTTTSDQGNTTTTTTPPDNGNTNKTVTVADVKVERKLPKEVKPGDEITVEVVISKGNLKGFARFQDVMPEGLSASAGDSKGGTFSFVDQKAKIVWDNIPADEQITITYKIKVTSAALGDQTIEGLFSYVENDEPKKIIITPSTITIDKPVDNTTVNNTTTTNQNNNTSTTTDNTNTNNTTTSNNNNTTTTTDNTTTNNNTNTNTTTDNTTTKVPDNTITNTPPPSTGVTYKVQICAAHNTVDGSYFQNKYSIGARINIESHEGWVKYTTGSFPVYKDARDHRESLRSKGVDGPFVTAYNKGTRITVQEALMIAGQQWYK